MAEAQIKVRMDRSKPYSTVHGERSNGDPHAGVVFLQDGLPFDAEGFLMEEKVSFLCDEKQQALAARLLEKAAIAATKRPPSPADDDDGDGPGEEITDPDQINIEAWLRGEQKVAWFPLSKAIKARFHKQVGNKLNAVEFLIVEESGPKLLPISQLSPANKALLRLDQN